MFLINIVAVLQRLFSTSSYGHALEQYIIAHKPTNAAEIENLVREYQFNQTRGWFQ